MIFCSCSSNIFYIFGSLWLFISYLIWTVNASSRYPYVLPKCCDFNDKLDEGDIVRCAGEERSEVVLLPQHFFPAMSSDTEYIEVELRNLEGGLQCKGGAHDHSDIFIDFAEVMEDFTTSNLETRRDFGGFAFSGDKLLASDGHIYSPRHYCIFSRKANKRKLGIKTCKQECNSRNHCIPRCCGGHQSVLTSPPSISSTNSLVSFCSKPILENSVWNPWTSQNVGGLNNPTHFYQTRYIPKSDENENHSFLQENCRLLRFTKKMLDDKNSSLKFLEDGRLQLKFDNTMAVIENFCIDGISGGKKRNQTRELGNECEAEEEEEVVVAYVCPPQETFPSAIPIISNISHDDNEFVSLPACSCLAHQSHQLFQLPSNLFLENGTAPTVLVRLMAEENNGGVLECHEKYEDFTVHFKDFKGSEILFSEDWSLIVNGLSLDQTQYCIRSLFHNAITVRTCKEECSLERPCINRCCSGNNHVDFEALGDLEESGDHRKMKCELQSSQTTHQTVWSPLFYNTTGDIHPTTKGDGLHSIHPVIRKRRPHADLCHFYLFKDQFKLLRTGDLIEKWEGENTWKKVNLEDYCIEPFMTRGEDGGLELSGNFEDIIVWKCFREVAEDQDEDQLILSIFVLAIMALFTAIFLGIPLLFYLGTAVVYILRKDKEPVFRWTIVCSCISTTFTYSLIGTIFIRVSIYDQPSDTNDIITGVVLDFVYLYGFLWMTTLCFDIWLTITFLSPAKKRMSRFWWYLAFTTTVPAVIGGIGVILNVANVQYDWEYLLDGTLIIILSCFNFLLFVATAVKLWIAQHSSEIKRSQRNTFLVYFKLFILIGFRWVADFISMVLLIQEHDSAVVGVLVLLPIHSFALFYLLVWNAETKRYMETNNPRVKGVMDVIDRIGGPFRKCCGICRCFKRSENATNSNGTYDIPLSSTYMHVHTYGTPKISN